MQAGCSLLRTGPSLTEPEPGSHQGALPQCKHLLGEDQNVLSGKTPLCKSVWPTPQVHLVKDAIPRTLFVLNDNLSQFIICCLIINDL